MRNFLEFGFIYAWCPPPPSPTLCATPATAKSPGWAEGVVALSVNRGRGRGTGKGFTMALLEARQG